MARKKKTNKKRGAETDEEDAEDDESVSFFASLHRDAGRSIAAVVLLTLGILFALGFFKSAGIIGVFFDRSAGMALGWGKWIFPFILFLSAIFLFRRKTSSRSDLIKLGGLTIAFLSVLGIFHFFQSGDLETVATKGQGGGYVGFLLAWMFLKLAGKIGGAVLFVALFLVGIIAAFNVSFSGFFDRVRTLFSRESESEEKGSGETDRETTDTLAAGIPEAAEATGGAASSEIAVPAPSSAETAPQSPETESERLEKGNIKNIRFADEKEGQDGNTAQSIHSPESLASVPAYFLASAEEREPAPRRRKPKPKRFWQLPPLSLLEASEEEGVAGGDTSERAEIIRDTLAHFGIVVTPKEVKVGPAVTQYTFSPASGVKLSRIVSLGNDLALALAAPSIRIEAPIPGKALVGIEVPNASQATVRLRNIFQSVAFVKRHSPLTVSLGKDVYGEYTVANLAKMPHLLVAGATNSGKSVFINSLLISLLYQNSPDDLQFVLVDPKRVELSPYNGIPHLISDVIVDPKKVVNALRSMVGEMDRRYRLLEQVGARDIESYRDRCERGEKRTIELPGGGTREEVLVPLPYVVIVIDEMADIMMTHGREVEALIVRLAQMARAVGIHLVLATQRPSVNVITGLIKANITSRIAFQVATQIDSRTILDQSGAEKLLGRGDMLFSTAGLPQPKRLQSAFVSEDEVSNVVEFLRAQKLSAGYDESINEDITKDRRGMNSSPQGNSSHEGSEHSGSQYSTSDSSSMATPSADVADTNESEFSNGMVFSLEDADESLEKDPRYEEAKRIVIETGRASTSALQRRMGLGYSRAARIMDTLEQDGVIGPQDGSKPREVFGTSPKSKEDFDEPSDVVSTDSSESTETKDKWQV